MVVATTRPTYGGYYAKVVTVEVVILELGQNKLPNEPKPVNKQLFEEHLGYNHPGCEHLYVAVSMMR